MTRGGGAGAGMFVAAVLVVALVAVEAQSDEMEKCLMDCVEKLVVCAVVCELKGGKTECEVGCGVGHIECVRSCMGSKDSRFSST